MEKNNVINVMLVDDHPLVIDGLSRLFQDRKDIEICGIASSANEAIQLLSRITPDVAIVDINLRDDISGIDLVKSIKERYPNISTIVLSMYDESTYAERAMRAGAKGYIPKNEASAKIIEAIKKVNSGELFMSKSVSDKIMEKMFSGPKSDSEEISDLLSNRELEVFKLLGQGCKTKEIASKLNLSKNTIDSHRRNIKDKLHLSNNNELIKTAAQWNLAREN